MRETSSKTARENRFHNFGWQRRKRALIHWKEG